MSFKTQRLQRELKILWGLRLDITIQLKSQVRQRSRAHRNLSLHRYVRAKSGSWRSNNSVGFFSNHESVKRVILMTRDRIRIFHRKPRHRLKGEIQRGFIKLLLRRRVQISRGLA